MSRYTQGVLLALFSAVCFGLTPFFAQAAYAGGANVVTLMALRYGVAAAVLAGVHARRRAPLRLRPGQWARLSLLGAADLVMSVCYYSAVRYIPPSLAVLLFYTFPVLVTLGGYFLFREPVGGRAWAALPLAMAGTALVVGASLDGIHPLGVLLGLGAALFYTVYTLLGSRLLAAVPPLTVTAGMCLTATGGSLLAGLGAGLAPDLTPAGWAAGLLGMGVVGTVLAVSAYFASIARVGAARTAILSMAEPLVTVGVGVAWFGDRLGGWQALGAALVLLSGLLVATDRAAGRAGDGRAHPAALCRRGTRE